MYKGRISRMKKAAVIWILSSIMFLCFAQAIFLVRPDNEKSVRILTNPTGYLRGEALSLIKQSRESEEDWPLFTIWGEEKEVSIHNPDLNREKKAGVLTVCGDSRLVWDSGSWLDMEDAKYCLLTEDLGLSLFGGTELVGQKVQIGECIYEVKGILSEIENTAMIQTGPNLESVMNKVSVEIPKGREQSDVLRQLSIRLGVSENAVNFGLYRTWAKAAAMILPCILGASIFFQMIRKACAFRHRPVKLLKQLIILFVFCILFFWITEFWPGIPKEMIPSRWSDFEFWTKLWEQKKTEILFLMQGEKTGPEMACLREFLNTFKYSILAVVLYFFSMRRQKIERLRDLFFGGVFFLCLAFMALLTADRYLTLKNGGRILWMLLPFYLFCSYVPNRLDSIDFDIKYSQGK